ncbi:MAG: hypothetical protein JSW54_00645 [Fidelibacterota bacterium]|nr:MAG: hypothetical protein JSW54_00645 [Candidatus Neomarinimicrobiota bacterium]
MIRSLVLLLSLLSMMMCVHIRSTDQPEQDVKIVFDDSAARCVLEDPARALAERDSIWDAFEGFRITRVWHEKSSYPVTWEIWERGLNRFINDDTTLIGRSLELADNLRKLENREHETIERHLAAYLPETAAFDAYVYLVAFTVPYAFCVEQNKIGIDLTADEWYFDPECLLNIMIHELYHVGYKLNSPDREYINADPTNYQEYIRLNYAYMLSEGLATHVGYKALDLFPTEHEHEDYKMLRDGNKVKAAIAGVNGLLSMPADESIDNLLKQAWDIGVTSRAYYVAGAHVCGTIEEKMGAEYLSGLVAEGGRRIVEEYNVLVPPDEQIHLVVAQP